MTALVLASILTGALLVLASIGIPLWLTGKYLTGETGYTQAWAYLRAKVPTAAVPAPRPPAEQAMPTLQRAS
jgi:hypothetical protein